MKKHLPSNVYLARIDLCHDEGIDFVLTDGRVVSMFGEGWSIYDSEEAHAQVMGLTAEEYRSDHVVSSLPGAGKTLPRWIFNYGVHNVGG